MTTNAVTIIEREHATLEWLFEEFHATPPSAQQARRTAIDQLRQRWAVYASLLEHLFYPCVLSMCPPAERAVREQVKVSHIIDELTGELAYLLPADDRFGPRCRSSNNSHVATSAHHTTNSCHSSRPEPNRHNYANSAKASKHSAPTCSPTHDPIEPAAAVLQPRERQPCSSRQPELLRGNPRPPPAPTGEKTV